MIKNDIIEIKIHDISFEGMGVSHYENMAVFVPNVDIDELCRVQIVKVKKTYCFAKLIEVIEPSPARITVDCSAFLRCGGCQYRHITYERELEIKRQRIIKAISKNCKTNITIPNVIGAKNTLNYRNKSQKPVFKDENEGIGFGFYAKNSHKIVESKICMLEDVRFSQIFETLNEQVIAQKINPSIISHIYLRSANSGIMLCIVVSENDKNFLKLALEISKKYSFIKSVYLNINKAKTNVILGEKYIKLLGDDTLTDILCDTSFCLSPASFYQVNKEQTEILYNTAIEMLNLTGDETVLDLYCGIGTITLLIAKKCKQAYGGEIIKTAIDNANTNKKLNNIQNAFFYTGDAYEVAKTLQNEGKTIDVITLDPPRKGCDIKLLQDIAKISPKKIVYISCCVETLARDIAILENLGYIPSQIQGVDLFPRTSHVECVVLMSRVGEDIILPNITDKINM